MIGSLHGVLIDKDTAGEILIEVSGVGYRVTVNTRTLADLPDIGTDAFVHIHHHIREDDQTLYGFATLTERKCFESVIGAHGVGPALGMAVLATLPPEELRHAVASEDVDALCLVPGVGKKTAQRMVLELKIVSTCQHTSNTKARTVSNPTQRQSPMFVKRFARWASAQKKYDSLSTVSKAQTPLQCFVKRFNGWRAND